MTRNEATPTQDTGTAPALDVGGNVERGAHGRGKERRTDPVALDALLGQLEPDALLRVSTSICEALGALHASGILHGDLEPSNILIDLQSGRASLAAPRLGGPASDAASARASKVSTSLAHLAPERIRRSLGELNARADLYSLGVCLYQLATGRLPSSSSEPLDGAPSHASARPIPSADRERLPEMFRRILLRLLEEDPADRYQTAAGLEHDLRECGARLHATGESARFALGSRDAPGRLLRRSVFKGRVAELDAISEALERVNRTLAPELALVAGNSGIGKSSLVREFLSSHLAPGTLVAGGKFEEIGTDAPYATLCRLFGTLCRWVAARPAQELSDWRGSLREALGANAAVVAELVPELELVLGSQPRSPQLPATEAHNRLQASFRALLRCFAERRRPLVLFLDDLQWVDSASLDLVEHLLLDPELRGVLVLGAYRVENVSSEHQLEHMLGRLSAGGRAISRIALASLPPPDVEGLVAEVLLSSPAPTETLARLVESKTGGNPFFVRQFLTALVEERLLEFDRHRGNWAWDLPGISAKRPTENLTTLLLERLSRLPAATQRVLETLACVGTPTRTQLIGRLSGVTADEVMGRLRIAVDAQIVAETANGYAFLHDKLLAAAYSLIPEAERPARHLAIGRALRERGAETSDDDLVELVRHLNRACSLLRDVGERVALAELNLKVAKRSRSIAASANALAHLEQAYLLLPSDHWQTLPKLSFELDLARAESKLLTGDYASAEGLLSQLAQRSSDSEQRSSVVCMQASLFGIHGRFAEALDVGLHYLRSVGVPWREIDADELRRQYEELRRVLGDRPVSALYDAPPMSSSPVLATMEVCAALHPAAFHSDQRLFALLTLYMATLSIEHGHCDISANAYAKLSTTLGPFFGEHSLGFEFGKLGSRLAERTENRFAGTIWLMMGNVVATRSMDAHSGPPWMVRAREAAERFGDRINVIYNDIFLVVGLLRAGAPLQEVEHVLDVAVGSAAELRYSLLRGQLRMLGVLVRTLRRPQHEPDVSDEEVLDEAFESSLTDTLDRAFYLLWRLQVHYFADEFAQARAAARRLRELLRTMLDFPEDFQLWFYGALAEAACAETADRSEALRIMGPDERELGTWAASCPPMFANKAALVSAECARLAGRDADAERYFERAAALAREHRLVHEEGLAHELAARFYAGRGVASVARAKLAQARACYAKWGAQAKVARLDVELASTDELGGAPWLAQALDQLDVRVLVSALQRVSSSLDLERLIDAFMKDAMHQLGAERGVLVLLADDPRIAARASSEAGAIRVEQGESPMSPMSLPESLVRYVLRSREQVVSRDGVVPDSFRDDAYFAEQSPRSLLCLPIVVRGKAVGALYLENTLTRQNYDERALAVVELIASQAAISLENARLYEQMRDAQQRMARAEHVSRTGSFSWRPQRQEIAASDEFSNIMGVGTPPVLAEIGERIHPGDRALFESMVNESARYDGQNVELRLVMPGGASRHIEVISSRLEADEFVGTVRDVTAAKQAEEVLQKTQAALTEVTRVASLAELAATLTHEVNQPLAAIGISASVCLDKLADDQPDLGLARRAAERIQQEARRAGAVIQGLKALFSKSEGVKVPVDLEDAISEVVVLARSRIRAASATLALEFGHGLPSALGDRVQLQQVLMNLLTNALEAMVGIEQGLRKLTIRTSLEDDGRLCCEVQDTGMGVSEANRARIFELFFTTKPNGMGMGLPICNHIIKSHGGELSVHANRGQPGSTFQFVLPSAKG